ncbi:MAG: EamA family transporter [Firmicutes bacterium]|nr:EamA family transporter [Bacillota bacterium]
MFRKIPGPILMVFSSICFALGGLLIKMVPWSGIALNGAISIIAVPVIAMYMKISGNPLKINRTVVIGSFCLAATTLLYAVANKLTAAGNVIALQFTSPIFVMLYSRFFFGKKTKKIDIIACIFVLAGVVIFLMDSLQAGNTLGNLMGVASGATFAGVYLMNEGKGASPLSSVLLADILSFVISLPWLLKADFRSIQPQAWTAVIVLGLIQMGLAYVFFTEGIKKTRPVTASLLSVIEVVLNPALVAVFLKETLSPMSLAGAVVILLSVTIYNVILVKMPKDETSLAAER